MFQNISVTLQVREQNDLDRYLAAPLEHVTDPLMWWWDNRKVYPVLSLMAMDFLAVPATSTSVKRVFSQGQHLLPFTRNRLATATTRMLMCFGAWSCHNLMRTNELVAAISRTCKKRARETIELSSDSGDN
ncbi:hATC-domain-containing protein [Schizophyllum commune Tattone D]|nr:hATC-domain-containing protein [Schizophyllum commune Tattone D]